MSGRKDLTGLAWARQRQRVLARDGHQCVACGATDDLTVDHIQPHALTGRDDYADHELAVLCRSCNSRKGKRIDARLGYANPAW